MTEKQEIQQVMMEHFTNVYQCGEPNNSTGLNLDDIASILPCLSDDHTARLQDEVKTDEIKVAVFQMGGLKALSPDGILTIFFQKYWYMIGRDVVQAV